jgi:hypothetical protein
MDKYSLLNNFRDHVWPKLNEYDTLNYNTKLSEHQSNMVLISPMRVLTHLRAHTLALCSVQPDLPFSQYEVRFQDFGVGNVNDDGLCFRSYAAYFWLDCSVLSNPQKKNIAFAIKDIAKQKTVSGKKHVIVLQNIEDLTMLIITAVKNMCEMLHDNIILICTAAVRRPQYNIIGTIVPLKYDTRRMYHDFTGKDDYQDACSIVDNLLRNGDSSASLHGKFVSLFEEKLMCLVNSDPKKAYTCASVLTTMIMTLAYPYPKACLLIVNALKDIYPEKICEIVKIVSSSQHMLVNSNKVQFIIDKMFLDLYKHVQEK